MRREVQFAANRDYSTHLIKLLLMPPLSLARYYRIAARLWAELLAACDTVEGQRL